MSLDHGVIGNGNLIALIHPDTGVDWLCVPRFDSPSVFGRLLDRERGGTWRFLRDGKPIEGKTKYVRNTNVLMHTFESGEDAWELFDFMPRIPAGLRHRAPLRMVRMMRPLRGRPRLSVELDPRPDYARTEASIVPTDHGVIIGGAGVPLTLYSNLPAPYLTNGSEFTLDRPRYFVLDCGSQHPPMHLDEVNHELDLTIAGWRAWAQSCWLPGFKDDEVIRSALCLKLHAYNETGAIIAATTTSIPEVIGQPRTWDYRYCWLRDSVFTVEALRRLSHFQEGRNFMQFVMDVAECGPLQPLYGIGGERDLHEMELDHLSGYKGTRPVRVGNQASEQRQTDLMGEVVLCLRTMLTDRRVQIQQPRAWLPLVERMVQEALDSFDEADLGIWEYRGEPRLFTFSRAMCWAAVHHGAAIACHFDEPELARTWQKEADRMREVVLSEHYSVDSGMFIQAIGVEEADASNLLLPSIGIIEHTDPRFLSTLEAYSKRLVRDGGVMRYVHEDDFGKPDSTFTICSFWWIEALALAGRLDEAVEMFEKVIAHANPLGLFSEDVDSSTGELLGNFPQAYTHIGLIHAALTIGAVQRGESGPHAWA